MLQPEPAHSRIPPYDHSAHTQDGGGLDDRDWPAQIVCLPRSTQVPAGTPSPPATAVFCRWWPGKLVFQTRKAADAPVPHSNVYLNRCLQTIRECGDAGVLGVFRPDASQLQGAPEGGS